MKISDKSLQIHMVTHYAFIPFFVTLWPFIFYILCVKLYCLLLDLQLRLELGTSAPRETAAEASSFRGTSVCLSSEVQSSDEKPIQLVEDILEEFEDDEERD